MTDEARNVLNKYLNIMSSKLIILIIDEAVNNNAKTLSYIKAILSSCEKEKIYTIEQFKKRQEDFAKNRKQHQNTKRTEIEQRDYTGFDFNSLCANFNVEGKKDERNTT